MFKITRTAGINTPHTRANKVEGGYNGWRCVVDRIADCPVDIFLLTVDHVD